MQSAMDEFRTLLRERRLTDEEIAIAVARGIWLLPPGGENAEDLARDGFLRVLAGGKRFHVTSVDGKRLRETALRAGILLL